MNRIKLLFLLIAMLLSFGIFAQVGINTDGTTPDASAILDLKSTEKGMLTPRMTQAQIKVISNPADGLIVYNVDDNHLYIYDNNTGEWKEIAIGTGTITPTPQWACGNTLVDSRDSKSYSTVQIGTQCWMAENLNIGTMLNINTNQSDNSTFEKYCYNNNASICDTYGGLYQWDEMMQYISDEGTQGICPTGWHLPTDAEWCILENEVDAGTISCSTMSWRGTDVGSNLKEVSTVHWYSPNTGATNSSGFTAIGGGGSGSNGAFCDFGWSARFWTSTEVDTLNVYSRYLHTSYVQISAGNSSLKNESRSVRCLKD